MSFAGTPLARLVPRRKPTSTLPASSAMAGKGASKGAIADAVLRIVDWLGMANYLAVWPVA